MVFGLFSKEKSLQRTIERATNKLAQQADRFGALEKLREEGTDEALLGLCKRWSITSNNQVEDQQEKAWVVDVLTAKGAVALKPIGRYMKSATQLSYALAVVGAVASKAQVLELVDPILADEPPGYTRDPERRLDLIRWLGEWKDGGADAATRLVPYLKDFDQNVRVAAADAIADADPALTAEPLLAAFLRPEEESGRFRKRIAEILAKHKHPLGEQAGAVASLLTGPVAGFAVAGGLLVER
jgi:HEAT repeat protein